MKLSKDYEIQNRKTDCQEDRTHSTMRFTFLTYFTHYFGINVDAVVIVVE